MNPFPIRNDKAFKSQFTFQQVGNQIFIGMTVNAVPLAEGHHNASNACLNGFDVTG